MKRYGTDDRRGQLRNRISIDKRPAIVARRCRIGDWELDTIIGKGRKQAIVSLTERKSRLALIAKVSSREAEGVKDAVLALFFSFPRSVWERIKGRFASQSIRYR